MSECGKTIDCKNCAISLTYHAYSQELNAIIVPLPSLFLKDVLIAVVVLLNTLVLGLNWLKGNEENLARIRVERLDVDTTQNKDAHQRY